MKLSKLILSMVLWVILKPTNDLSIFKVVGSKPKMTHVLEDPSTTMILYIFVKMCKITDN